ncbi:MAG: hypothetical protein HC786_00830 [Richelia sp. CSU_2_1]|nr:hypothetical protein [Microcoleus sp. SU_5_6]NJL68696.1 hypothetical protein [Microcoleus sp. SM1_3_4]NJR20828.1 hypothetical protein [Richelia sp. CSU_2_1]
MPSQVLGSGPIGFTDANGNQKFIPLSELDFVNGEVKADKWHFYKANKSLVDALLKDLVAGGFLISGTSTPTTPAMLLEAAISGNLGNHIQVNFSNIVADSSTPANSTFDCTITAKDTYSDLSLDSNSSSFIKKVLGIETTAGSLPSLVRVKDAGTLSLPKSGSYVLAGGGDAAKASKAIDGDPSGTAFTLEAWNNGSDGQYITATVSQIDAAAKTFTLVVEWKQPAIQGIKVADLPNKLSGNGLVLKVSQPEGGNFAIPTAGTIILSGGADAKAATKASAIAIAQS